MDDMYKLERLRSYLNYEVSTQQGNALMDAYYHFNGLKPTLYIYELRVIIGSKTLPNLFNTIHLYSCNLNSLLNYYTVLGHFYKNLSSETLRACVKRSLVGELEHREGIDAQVKYWNSIPFKFEEFEISASALQSSIV